MSVSFSEISRMSLFRGFNQSFIQLLDLFFIEENYEPDTLLIEEGRLQNRFFMLFAGEVAVSHLAPSGQDIVLGHLAAGQFFGEMNLFDPGLATASVRSLTPVRTLEISNEKFRYFIQEKPELAADFTFQLTETIVKRFRDTNDKLLEQLMNPENLRKADQLNRGVPA
ncbi:MAG: Crp/Fnr family transcriptional regulator [Candidatus Methylacidiphilales bacterium]